MGGVNCQPWRVFYSELSDSIRSDDLHDRLTNLNNITRLHINLVNFS